MTEDEAVEIQWQANIDRVQSAKEGIRRAVRYLAQVERAVATACARRRFPTDEEIALIDAAKGAVAAAHQEHEDAKMNFKSGVTSDQITSIMEVGDAVS